MPDLFHAHRGGFWTAARKRSLYVGLLLLGLALVIHIYAGYYSSLQSSEARPVGDLFLDHLPVVNLDFLLVGGSILIFWVLAISLFVIIRAFFTTLTHIGIYPESYLPGIQNTGFLFYRMVNFEGSLFFSGHTGFPFIMALIFWDNAFWRRFFLVTTMVFGAAVLLAHVHYSIDVFAAPFIVYSIFVITTRLFPDDYALAAAK